MKTYPHPHPSCRPHHRYIDLDESEIGELPDVLVIELGRMTVGASHLSSLVFQAASGPRTSRFTMTFADIDAFQLEFRWRDRCRSTLLTVPRDVYTLGHSEWRRNNKRYTKAAAKASTVWAYLLAFVQDDAIVGFGVFSEDRPSHTGTGYWLTVNTHVGHDYEAARAGVLADTLRHFGDRFGPRCKDALERLAANPDSRGERLENIS